MDAFARARRMMVDGQIRTNDVNNPRLIAALEEIPRERFAPPGKTDLAYLDCDLEVLPGAGERPARYLLKPLVLARLIEIAAPGPSERALDVGCATGYSAAVLARLATRVVAVEEEPILARSAAANLAALKAADFAVHTGPLAEGAEREGPFDVILINGAVEFLPPALTRQLGEGGRLVCVMRKGPVGQAMVFRASEGHLSGRAVFDAMAPLLPGFVQSAAFVF